MGTPGIAWTPGRRAAAAGAILLAAVYGFSLYGPWILDDAYIIFRYADRIASGVGFTYNDGVRVLGSSTPSFTLLLAATAFVGLPLPATAVVIGVVAGAASLAMVVLLARECECETAGWAAALLTSLHFFWVVMLTAGMETPVYTLAILALLWSTLRRPAWVGVLGGLTMLTRYDGLVPCVTALAFVAWRQGWRRGLREAVITAAVYLPWFAFSWIYFGSPMPQTILAKSVAHYASFLDALGHLRVYLGHQPLWILALALAALGAWSMRLKPEHLVVPTWLLAHAGIFLAGHAPVMFFIWYLVPLIPGTFLLAMLGVQYLGGRSKRVDVCAVGALVLALAMVHRLPDYTVLNSNNIVRREDAYRATAAALTPLLKPGESVLTGEVGTLGWYLPQARIIDGFGLVSPEVTAIRRRLRAEEAARGFPPETWPSGSPDATRAMIRELKPDFVTTRKAYLYIDVFLNEPWFTESYEQLPGGEFGVLEQWTFRRKPGT